MTTLSETSAVSADPAIALADALQSGFAAQRSGCQRTRRPARPESR
jgi:hypothetical protein